MFGSMGWRLFFAAMLLIGVFMALRPEGKTVPAGTQSDVVAVGMEDPYLIGTNKPAQVDTPGIFKSLAESGDFATVGQFTVEKALFTSDITEVAEFHVANTDKTTLAIRDARAYHLLTFQVLIGSLEVNAQSSPANYRLNVKEGRADANRGVPRPHCRLSV